MLDELIAEIKDLQATRDSYFELIGAVGNKYPDETRHETALRYIRQAENGGCASTHDGLLHLRRVKP